MKIRKRTSRQWRIYAAQAERAKLTLRKEPKGDPPRDERATCQRALKDFVRGLGFMGREPGSQQSGCRGSKTRGRESKRGPVSTIHGTMAVTWCAVGAEQWRNRAGLRNI